MVPLSGSTKKQFANGKPWPILSNDFSRVKHGDLSQQSVRLRKDIRYQLAESGCLVYFYFDNLFSMRPPYLACSRASACDSQSAFGCFFSHDIGFRS